MIIFVIVVFRNSSDRFKFPFNDFNFEINTQVNPISRVHDSDSNDWNRLLGANESDLVQYCNNQFCNELMRDLKFPKVIVFPSEEVMRQ